MNDPQPWQTAHWEIHREARTDPDAINEADRRDHTDEGDWR